MKLEKLAWQLHACYQLDALLNRMANMPEKQAAEFKQRMGHKTFADIEQALRTCSIPLHVCREELERLGF